MDDRRLPLLRDCAVSRPDGTIVSLSCLRSGATVARINDRFLESAARTVRAWAMDHTLLLPDVVIWPNVPSMMASDATRRLRDASVAALDDKVAELLTTDEQISNWRVRDGRLVHISGPRRRVDHVIDLGDVFR